MYDDVISCQYCFGWHYYENDQRICEEWHKNTRFIEEVFDADISNPPEWIRDLEFPYYSRNDPRASWNLPK